jgi:hypothetical protein
MEKMHDDHFSLVGPSASCRAARWLTDPASSTALREFVVFSPPRRIHVSPH